MPVFLLTVTELYYLVVLFFPTNDVNTPIIHSTVKIKNITFELFTKLSIFDSEIF